MHIDLNEGIHLCALHIASVADTFSGVTFATKYFRDSPVVKVRIPVSFKEFMHVSKQLAFI